MHCGSGQIESSFPNTLTRGVGGSLTDEVDIEQSGLFPLSKAEVDSLPACVWSRFLAANVY